MAWKRPLVIAEIGCNHRGDFDTAMTMIQQAKAAGADGVKFQKRNIKECLTDEQYYAPHPVSENSYGATYGEHREFLEFCISQHRELKAYCDKLGIMYSTSVWDATSAREIALLEPSYIKVGGPSNTHYEIYQALELVDYQGEVHVSLGMTTFEEERSIYNFFKSRGKQHRLCWYVCTSSYPSTYEEICLCDIERLKAEYPGVPVGYSAHHIGIALDNAIAALGAFLIERHYTLDRSWKGTDHQASILPGELAQLVENLDNLAKTMKTKQNMSEREMEQREKLKGV